MALSKFIERPRYLCALGGAIGTLTSLPRVVPILHSASGCGGNLAAALNGAAGYYGTGYCSGSALSSSNVFEKDIVFGGEERLAEQIENTLKLLDGDLYFVITGCMVEMIGDDVEGVVKQYKHGEATILAAETGGFRGNSYAGYEIILKTLFRDFVAPATRKDHKVINLWGVVPFQDVFWEGNLTALKSLINKLGYTVNTFFGEGETLANLKEAASATLNVVVSDVYGIEAAQLFEEIHDVPYITASFPIGPHGTEKFLHALGSALKIEKAFVNKVIEKEKSYYYHYVQRLADVYNDLDLQRYSTVVGDSVYAQAITRFLADDLGWLPELVIVTDVLTDEQKELIKATFKDYESKLQPKIIFDTDAVNVLKHIRCHWPLAGSGKYYDGFHPGFIVGSSIEKDVSEKLAVPFLSVTYPVSNRIVLDRSYAGFSGALRLAEDILGILVANR